MPDIRTLPISELEVSVRTHNVLKKAGYINIGAVLDLDEKTARALPNAGARTWREIAELQESLKPPSQQEIVDEAWCDFVRAVGTANSLMRRHPQFRAVVVERGEIMAYETDRDTAERRPGL